MRKYSVRESSPERGERDLNLLITSSDRNSEGFVHPDFRSIQVTHHKALGERVDSAYLQGQKDQDKQAIGRGLVAAKCSSTAFKGFDYSQSPKYETAVKNLEHPELKDRPLEDLYSLLIRRTQFPQSIERILNWNLPQRPQSPEDQQQAAPQDPDLAAFRRLTPLQQGITRGFARLLLAGSYPSSDSILHSGWPNNTTHTSIQGIELAIPDLESQLKDINLPLSKLPGVLKLWPESAPIQTIPELADVIAHYSRNTDGFDGDKIPDDLRVWLAMRHDSAAVLDKPVSVKNYELVPQDLAVLRPLLAMGPKTGFVYQHTNDILPVLKRTPEFAGESEDGIFLHVRSTLAVTPERYNMARRSRDRDLAALAKNPHAPGHLMNEFFRKLKATRVTHNGQSLEDIQPSLLSDVLYRRISFENLQQQVVDQGKVKPQT